MATQKLYPNGAGTWNQWNYPILNPHWGEVDEDPHDGATSHVDHNGIWIPNGSAPRDSYEIDGWTHGAKHIEKVEVVFVGRITSTTGKITPFLYNNSTGGQSLGTARTMTTSWVEWTEELSRPGGGSWRHTDLADIEVGIIASGGSGFCKFGNCTQCTQVYVKVTYSDYYAEWNVNAHINDPWPTKFYLSDDASDLSVSGGDFDNKLLEETESDGFEVVIVNDSDTETNHAWTDAGVLNNDDWETGPILVRVNLIDSGDPVMYLRLSASRVNSSGVVQESTSWTAQQLLDEVVSGTRQYYFIIPPKDWASGNTGDRLRVNYEFENTGYSIPGQAQVVLETGLETSMIGTYITKKTLVQLGACTVTSSAKDLTVSPGATTVLLFPIPYGDQVLRLFPRDIEVIPITNIPLGSLQPTVSPQDLTVVAEAAIEIALSAVTAASSAQNLTVVPGTATIQLSTVTVTSSAENTTVSVGTATVSLSPATLTSSARDVTVSVQTTVSLSAATLTSSVENVTVVAGAATVSLGTVTLVSSAEDLSVVAGTVTIQLSTTTLVSSAGQIVVSVGATTVLLDPTTLTSSARVSTVSTGATTVGLGSVVLAATAPTLVVVLGGVTVSLDSTTVSAAVRPIVVVPGAATVTLSSVTVVSSALSLDVTIAGLILLSSVSVTSSARSVDVVPGTVQKILGVLTLSSTAETLTVVPGTVAIAVDALDTTLSARSVDVVPGSVAILFTTTLLSSSAESITVSAVTTVPLDALTLTSSPQVLTVYKKILLSALSATVTAEQIDVIGGETTVDLATTSLTVAAQDLVLYSLATILLDGLEVASSVRPIVVVGGSTSVSVDPAQLTLGLPSWTVFPGYAPQSIPLDSAALSLEAATLVLVPVTVLELGTLSLEALVRSVTVLPGEYVAVLDPVTLTLSIFYMNFVGGTVVLTNCRGVIMRHEDRLETIETDDRTWGIDGEDRTWTVDGEDRTELVPADDRTRRMTAVDRTVTPAADDRTGSQTTEDRTAGVPDEDEKIDLHGDERTVIIRTEDRKEAEGCP